METKEEELLKMNKTLSETLKKREEQLVSNSSTIADFNTKNQNLVEEIEKCSGQIVELQNMLTKKVMVVY